MNDQAIVYLPLSRLNPITLENAARKTNGIAVDSLAASIFAEGLLQNLTVVADDKCEFAGSPELQKYYVIAGNRRLRALRLLRDRTVISDDYLVPCKVIEESAALTASYAENAIREPMHAADEFVAFRDMIAQGHSIEDVAARFGVTPLVVQRRLKLANVAPTLFELFRTGAMSLDQMMALAISDDHKQQEKAWFDAEQPWQRQAYNLREVLTKKEISFANDPIAKFVGREAFEAAGGVVHVDLFSDKNDGYVSDKKLLQKLAAARLEEAAVAVRKEAWSWVEVHPTLDHNALAIFTKAPATGERKPTDQERQLLNTLKFDLRTLTEKLQKLDDQDEQDLPEYSDMEERVNEIEWKVEEVNLSLKTWNPKILAHAGAIVTIDGSDITVHRGLVRGKLNLPKSGGSTTDAGDEPPAGKLGHSATLLAEMTARLTHALRAELIAEPGMALIALTHRLLARQFYSGAPGSFSHPIAIRYSDCNRVLAEQTAENCIDIVRLQQEHADLERMLPKDYRNLWSWLTSETDQADVVRLLAYCIARSVDAVSHTEEIRPGTELAGALSLDMSTRWTPQADNYLKRVSTEQIIADLTQAGAGAEELEELKALTKKADLVDRASAVLTRANYLPAPLRTSGVHASATSRKASPSSRKSHS